MSTRMSRPEWALILILATINFTHIVDFVIVMPLGERLMGELQLSPAQFGHIVSAYGLAAAIAGILFALAADRFDRKHSLLVVYAGFIAATVFCGWAGNYETLLVARTLAGAFGGLSASCILAVIGDTFADGRRGTAMGVVMSAFAVASIVGLPLGLWLANRFGRGAPFEGVAAASVPVWILAAMKLPRVIPQRSPHRRHAMTELWTTATRPAHLRSFAFMLSLVLGTFIIIPFIAPYLESNGGRSKDDIPGVYAIAGACTFIGLIVLGRLTDRIGKKPVFLATALGSMVMTLILTHLPEVSYAGATLSATLFMVTAAGRSVPAQAIMLAAADPDRRGSFTSLNNAVSHFGTGLAPIIAGQIIGRGESGELTGYGTAGFVAVGFAAISLFLSALVHPQRPRTTGSQTVSLAPPMAMEPPARAT